MTVNGRYDQVRFIRVFDDGIAGVPWLHVGCTDDVRGLTKAGPLHNADLYHDLEISVKGHSRSFELVPFESLVVVFYSPFLFPMLWPQP